MDIILILSSFHQIPVYSALFMLNTAAFIVVQCNAFTNSITDDYYTTTQRLSEILISFRVYADGLNYIYRFPLHDHMALYTQSIKIQLGKGQQSLLQVGYKR